MLDPKVWEFLSALHMFFPGGIGEQLCRRHLVDAGAFVRQCSTVAGLDLA